MAPPTTGSRKRGRPRKDDSLALETSAAKKQRLNPTASLQRATASSSRAEESKVITNGALRRGKQPIDNTWEIPETDEETTQAPGKRANRTSRRPAEKPRAVINGVYDFPGSDEGSDAAQLPLNKTKGVDSTRTRGSTVKPAKSSASTKTGTRGHAGRSAPVSGLGKGEAALAAAIRRSRGAHKTKVPIQQARDESVDASDSDDVLTQTEVGASQRKTAGETPLKGILTPSRRLSKHNPKSVSFGESRTKEDEVFFADLPSKPVKTKTSSQARLAGKENKPLRHANDAKETVEEDDDEDEEDDEVCVICLKPDSKRPNEILFCDSCDMAVHQKCYGVDKIPKGDWHCKDCAGDVISGPGEANKSTSVTVAESVPDVPNFEQHLRAMQRVLLDRCTGKRLLRLRDQDEAYNKTFQLVEQTVLAGEGNSMLIIGARGCGKTTMVDTVLSDIGAEHKHEFHVIRLNGFIHTDDKLALKDIWRQLGKEMEVEDDLIGKTNNYADTLASLLALLSHPSEIAESQDGVTSKSVVFVIDEFDLFATHARQTLLYNLFDIAQARKAPIAVLGLTNKIDVVESLEKRVKSRFSHRFVYLSLAKTFPAYWSVCKQGLMVEDGDAKTEGLDIAMKGFTQFQDYWTKKIDTLSKEAAFKDHIEYYYYGTKSVPAFLSSCILPLANLSPTDMTLRFTSGPDLAQTSTDPPDSKLHLLASLSDLDLSLLISAARLDIVAHTDTVNFAMAYDEYTTLIGRQRVQSSTSGMLALGGGSRVWGRGVAEMAWERLASLGLLLPAGIGGARQAGMEGRMWKVDVTLEEIPAAVKLNSVLARWCREI